jgi:hypothetical protein
MHCLFVDGIAVGLQNIFRTRSKVDPVANTDGRVTAARRLSDGKWALMANSLLSVSTAGCVNTFAGGQLFRISY